VFFGDENSDLMTNVIIAVSDKQWLIECAHGCSFFVNAS
jgi:hypothetical protein